MIEVQEVDDDDGEEEMLLAAGDGSPLFRQLFHGIKV